MLNLYEIYTVVLKGFKKAAPNDILGTSTLKSKMSRNKA
jgi:hypothetical protein